MFSIFMLSALSFLFTSFLLQDIMLASNQWLLFGVVIVRLGANNGGSQCAATALVHSLQHIVPHR